MFQRPVHGKCLKRSPCDTGQNTSVVPDVHIPVSYTHLLPVSIKRFTIHTGEGRKHRNRKLLCAEQFIQAFRIAACRCKHLLAGFECPFLTRAVVGYVRKRNIKFTEITLKFPDFFTGCSALVRCFDRILRIFQMVNLNSVLFAVMNRFMKRNNLSLIHI